ncbi:MAG: hypothetical protein L0I35_02480, partial [Hafniaceae bacterium]|nr:hypothetical protein [Hafniaceae bacterium]
ASLILSHCLLSLKLSAPTSPYLKQPLKPNIAMSSLAELNFWHTSCSIFRITTENHALALIHKNAAQT